MPPPRRYELTDEQWKLIAPIMPPKKTGGQWNDHRTTLNGTIDRILNRLRLKLDKEGYIDWDVWCVDGSNVRGHVAVAGASEVSKKTDPASPATMLWVIHAGDGEASPSRDLR